MGNDARHQYASPAAHVHIKSLTVWGDRQLRNKLTRVWWWLGREEYWHQVQVDVVRCLQMTLMLFLMIWGAYA